MLRRAQSENTFCTGAQGSRYDNTSTENAITTSDSHNATTKFHSYFSKFRHFDKSSPRDDSATRLAICGETLVQ